MKKNTKIKFSTKDKQKLYDSLPYFVDIDIILKNSDTSYVVPGGIRNAGARYPDFLINKRDILLLTYILQKKGILDIKDWKKACYEIVKIIQFSLQTDKINNIKTGRWAIFDYENDSFRDLCMNINNYRSYKGKFIPTSLSMILFLFGDCREHNILLLYFMRIYFYYNNEEDRYFVNSLYTTLGVDSGNKRLHYKNLNYEHTFPIVIDKKTEKFFCIDALLAKTDSVKYPSRQMNLQELIIHKNFFEGGYNLLKQYKNRKVLFKLVDWFSKQKMEKIKIKTTILYAIEFKKIDNDLWFDKKFLEKIHKSIFNSTLCRK